MRFKHTTVAVLLAMSNIAIADEYADIETIVVEGEYLSTNRSNAVKTPTPVIDVPQSLSIIGAEELVVRGFTSIGDIINYTPGVNTSQGEGHRDSVVFRGNRSTADFYIDGNRDDVQYFRSLYNVEQVEILRGPNALLFGRGGTGGILNRVSKKAQLAETFTNYKTALNSFGGYNLELDRNIAATDSAAFRVNAMYEHLENHRDYYDGDRYGFNPTATFNVDDKTTLVLSYEYVDHERFIDRGIPTDTNGKPIEAFEDTVFADPENNYHTLDANVVRATLEHFFTDDIKGNFSAFYGDYDKVYANFYASGYDQTTNLVTLDGYIDATERSNAIFSGNIVAELDTGGIHHTLMIGGESIFTESDQNRFNPVFSTTGNDKETFIADRSLDFRGLSGTNANGEAFTVQFSDLNDDTRVDLEVLSFYIQDEIEISEKLNVILGARFDSFKIDVYNAKDLDYRERTDEEVSPRAGIIYKPQENISIYASYSESFLPRSGEQYANINGDNDELEPDTFENQEIGIKWDFAQGLSFTAAYFENKQSSPQVADNDPSTLDVIDSEISGFELQLRGQIKEDWFVSANYSSLDGEIVNRNGGTGLTPRELPEKTFSIWTEHQLSDVFGVGLGVTYQGESFIDNGNSATLPSYTRLDANAYYLLSDDLRIQLNVENLTDELYFPNAHATHQATVGESLNAMLTIVGSL